MASNHDFTIEEVRNEKKHLDPEPEEEPKEPIIRVKVVDFNLPWWRMVVLIIQFALALVPAGIALAVLYPIFIKAINNFTSALIVGY